MYLHEARTRSQTENYELNIVLGQGALSAQLLKWSQGILGDCSQKQLLWPPRPQEATSSERGSNVKREHWWPCRENCRPSFIMTLSVIRSRPSRLTHETQRKSRNTASGTQGLPLSSQTALIPLLASSLGGTTFQPLQLPEKKQYFEVPNPMPGISVYLFKPHSSPKLPRWLIKVHRGHQVHSRCSEKVGLVWICSRVRPFGGATSPQTSGAELHVGERGLLSLGPPPLLYQIPGCCQSWLQPRILLSSLQDRGDCLEPHGPYPLHESLYHKIWFRTPHLLTAI